MKRKSTSESEAESTNARHRGGVTHSSVEKAVMVLEQRGYITRNDERVNQKWEELVNQTRSFEISKWEVLEAYKRVRKNAGSAGVDEQTIEIFERDLKNNLYKIWNRMSSGSYFPSPVRQVEIPKRDGKKRPLGIPMVIS